MYRYERLPASTVDDLKHPVVDQFVWSETRQLYCTLETHNNVDYKTSKISYLNRASLSCIFVAKTDTQNAKIYYIKQDQLKVCCM